MPLAVLSIGGSNHGKAKAKTRKNFTPTEGFYGVWQAHGEAVHPPQESCHVAGGYKNEKFFYTKRGKDM